MPGEGVSRANPTVLLWQPPQTGLGLRTKAGWGMAGRWAKTALHYSHPEEKHSPGSFPDSGCSSTLQLGPWTCLFMPRTSCCSLSPRSESQEQTGSPLPRLFRSIAFPSLPPVSKTQLPNSESYFPTLRKEGMPTHRKASVVQSHPGRKPRWEAAGHLLVREETTISWAPWTRPTLGCISHLHTINLAATAVQTPLQGWPLAAEAGGRRGAWAGGFFLPSETTGPLPVWSHLCAFISLVQTETGPFSRPSCALGHRAAGRRREGWGCGRCVLPDPVGSTGAASNALPPLAHLAGKPGANSTAPRPVALEGTSEAACPTLPSESLQPRKHFHFLAPLQRLIMKIPQYMNRSGKCSTEHEDLLPRFLCPLTFPN